MSGYGEFLLKLPGTEEEKEWLESRLEMLSVQGIVLAAAVERKPPENMADAVNHLLTLDQYKVIPAGSYEQLGELYLETYCVPEEQIPYFNKSALGEWYEDQHPGLFVGSHYVSYPAWTCPVPYDGGVFPPDDEWLDWSVRLKLASGAVPEGVWVRLPDYEELSGRPDEVRLALDALGWKTVDECTLLDARCTRPEMADLAEQYGSLADLVYDGDLLGFILNERSQEDRGYLTKFFAVLEWEHCSRLEDALDIAQDLSSYELTRVDRFLDEVMEEFSRAPWAKDGRKCFDYAAYAASLAEQQGYSVTDDGQYYIRKRDSPSLYRSRTA